jgi:hypothetical protein
METNMFALTSTLILELLMIFFIAVILGIRFIGPTSLRQALSRFYYRHIPHA